MARRREAVRNYVPVEDDEETSSSRSESGSESSQRCVSCQETYEARDAGTCKECYEEANDSKEELKRQIDALNSTLSFLRLSEPRDLPFSDVVLIAAPPSSPIPAHKAVLASRSRVLRAMLESEMSEGRSGTIRVEDAREEALRAFVEYMYRGEAVEEGMAWEVLVLADKYEVGQLKAQCQASLIAGLTCDTAVSAYAFAHRHNAPLLLRAALSHITDNIHSLSLSPDYLHLKASDPRLLVDIYEAYLPKQLNTAQSPPTK